MVINHITLDQLRWELLLPPLVVLFVAVLFFAWITWIVCRSAKQERERFASNRREWAQACQATLLHNQVARGKLIMEAWRMRQWMRDENLSPTHLSYIRHRYRAIRRQAAKLRFFIEMGV